jgi:hypothetical protein
LAQVVLELLVLEVLALTELIQFSQLSPQRVVVLVDFRRLLALMVVQAAVQAVFLAPKSAELERLDKVIMAVVLITLVVLAVAVVAQWVALQQVGKTAETAAQVLPHQSRAHL